MSTYFKVWNATIDGPDPDSYTPEPEPLAGLMERGAPIVQGREAGTLRWAVLNINDFGDLWGKWNTSKAITGVFVIPPRTSGGSWTVWRSVTAYAEEPQCTYRGNNVADVTMRILIVA